MGTRPRQGAKKKVRGFAWIFLSTSLAGKKGGNIGCVKVAKQMETRDDAPRRKELSEFSGMGGYRKHLRMEEK